MPYAGQQFLNNLSKSFVSFCSPQFFFPLNFNLKTEIVQRMLTEIYLPSTFCSIYFISPFLSQNQLLLS